VGDPPDPERLRNLYSFDAGYHTSCAGDDGPEGDLVARAAREHFEILSRYRRPGRVLDVGCSSGHFLRVARENGWQTQGLEISADTARTARERFGLDVSAGTLDDVALPERHFDVVTMWDVIEHLRDPRGAMSIVHRILKDDGLVVFLTPNIGGLFPRVSYAVSRIAHYWPHPEPPHHLFQFSKSTASRLARESGFTVRALLDRRISLRYTFGDFAGLLKSPGQLLYAAVFAPIAAVGPWIGAGDEMVVVAEKAKR